VGSRKPVRAHGSEIGEAKKSSLCPPTASRRWPPPRSTPPNPPTASRRWPPLSTPHAGPWRQSTAPALAYSESDGGAWSRRRPRLCGLIDRRRQFRAIHEEGARCSGRGGTRGAVRERGPGTAGDERSGSVGAGAGTAAASGAASLVDAERREHAEVLDQHGARHDGILRRVPITCLDTARHALLNWPD